ncbi:type II toxin-antitoxin system VapC family toxin [Patescibacteria group bacterium]|nr:type II toxin-antitoxin system VapC family toxin [Patescibacteria group bacterium]
MLLDTNIIIYSLSSKSDKKIRAQEFILKNKNRLTIAHQNINEAIRFLTHPKTPKNISAKKAIRIVLNATSELKIISPKPITLHTALALIKKYNIKSNQVFDTYLIATMLTNSISEIATDNEKDFKIFKGIKVINPFGEK